MATPDLFVLDKGTLIRFLFKEDGAAVDLSAGGIVVKFRFCSPDSTITFDVTADPATDGSDGLFEYTTLENHFQGVDGAWTLYAFVEISSTQHHYATPKVINVHYVPATS